jgi:hypothetical protein
VVCIEKLPAGLYFLLIHLPEDIFLLYQSKPKNIERFVWNTSDHFVDLFVKTRQVVLRKKNKHAGNCEHEKQDRAPECNKSPEIQKSE